MSTGIIVFGPTGAVAGAAAQEAQSRGNKVWLAMRDTNKKLKFDAPESAFPRIQADLSDPSSVKNAIEKSGAKSAFVYVVHGIPMRPAIQALKDAGVTWIVLLSSYTVRQDPRKYEPKDVIPYLHAQAEIAIEEVGIAFAALRPGSFASNLFMWFYQGLKNDDLKICCLDMPQDHIVPQNIGQVGGALLTRPQPERNPSNPEIIYLCGPKIWTQGESIEYVARAMGKDTSIVTEVSAEEWGKGLMGNGLPKPIVEYFVRVLSDKSGNLRYENGFHEKATANIEKYSGKKPIAYEEYIAGIKGQLVV